LERISISKNKQQISKFKTVINYFIRNKLLNLVLSKLNDFGHRIGDIDNSMTLLKAFSGGNSSDGGSGVNMQALMDALS